MFASENAISLVRGYLHTNVVAKITNILHLLYGDLLLFLKVLTRSLRAFSRACFQISRKAVFAPSFILIHSPTVPGKCYFHVSNDFCYENTPFKNQGFTFRW